jgi:ribosomal protein L30/L7E
LDDILSAVEALAMLVLAPAHSSTVHPDHQKIHGLLNAVADLRVALKLAG